MCPSQSASSAMDCDVIGFSGGLVEVALLSWACISEGFVGEGIMTMLRNWQPETLACHKASNEL